MGGIWRNLELCSRKPKNFISNPGGSLEDHDPEKNMNSRNQVHQISEENTDTIGKKAKGHL